MEKVMGKVSLDHAAKWKMSKKLAAEWGIQG